MRAAVLAVGVVCALGEDPEAVRAALAAGQRGLLVGEGGLAGRVPGPDLRPWLQRRKDTKLLARPAVLALAAAGRALEGFAGDREALGLFFGVRREPPDTGEADAALAASARGGRLDLEALARAGRDLYPPLLPLRTLPNMALAHVSINLGLMGWADTFAGGAAAGIMALREAIFALYDGRCPQALAVATDSQVDPGSMRDRARLGECAPPGEAAVALLLAPAGAPGALWEVEAGSAGAGAPPDAPPLQGQLGDCGAAAGLLALTLARPARLRAVDPTGAWAECGARVISSTPS